MMMAPTVKMKEASRIVSLRPNLHKYFTKLPNIVLKVVIPYWLWLFL